MSQPPSSQAPSDDQYQLDLNPMSVEAAAERMFEHAAQMNASDLFLMSQEDFVAIHVRHLGRVRKLGIVSADKGRRLIQHVKVQSELDVAEHRRPQDGRFIHESDDESLGPIDIRVNSIPTLYGEDLSLRLLHRMSRKFGLEDLGMLRSQLGEARSLIDRPGGLVLCVGPAGAGKTTTLYSAIHRLHDGSLKINTIEDPVEYGIDGVRQSQIDPAVGVGFAEMLRGVLRQSPDVIMVGEVRDEDTAQAAVRAASAGRLVLASVHANVATAAVETILNFGVNPHFLATALRGVIAQRLVRTLDEQRRIEVDLDHHVEMFEPVRPILEDEPKLFAASGEGPNDGFSGLTGVFEIFRVTPETRHLINEEADTSELRRAAIRDGMIDFRRAALVKVARGETSLDEVFRVVPFDFLRADEESLEEAPTPPKAEAST